LLRPDEKYYVTPSLEVKQFLLSFGVSFAAFFGALQSACARPWDINKVYGDRPNYLPLQELEKRWDYANGLDGIDENMSIDNCLHSVFGASKVAADAMLKDRARSDADHGVRIAAVRELARGWKDDPDTLPLLKDRARSDTNSYVRYWAVQELARDWKDDPEVIAILSQDPPS
jgi:HEAT repeats